MKKIEIVPVELDKQIRSEITALVPKAMSIKITSPEIFLRAGEMLKSFVAMRKKIVDHYDKYIKMIRENIEILKKDRDADLAPILPAIEFLDKVMVDYQLEQEQIKREAEKKALALQQKIDEEAREKARLANKSGDKNKANAILERAEEKKEAAVDKIMTKAEPVKAAGLSFREDWTYEVINERLIPDAYWKKILDTKKIGEEVTRNKAETKIPGIRAYSKKTPLHYA
jgi:seryl-tRNA synthetase